GSVRAEEARYVDRVLGDGREPPTTAGAEDDEGIEAHAGAVARGDDRSVLDTHTTECAGGAGRRARPALRLQSERRDGERDRHVDEPGHPNRRPQGARLLGERE